VTAWAWNTDRFWLAYTRTFVSTNVGSAAIVAVHVLAPKGDAVVPRHIVDGEVPHREGLAGAAQWSIADRDRCSVLAGGIGVAVEIVPSGLTVMWVMMTVMAASFAVGSSNPMTFVAALIGCNARKGSCVRRHCPE